MKRLKKLNNKMNNNPIMKQEKITNVSNKRPKS